MSIFHTAVAKCPGCNTRAEVERVASVNADRRPDQREAIIDGSFQAQPCAQCGAPLRLAPHLSYLDIGRGNWILAEDVDEIANWSAHEAEARALFDGTFGPGAPAPVRELGEGLRPRLVFGWPALREKLLCSAMGIDDLALELLKAAVMRFVPAVPLGRQGVSMRLTAADTETVVLTAMKDASESRIVETEVPRGLLADISGDHKPWAAMREVLERQVFLDLNRILIAA